MSGFGFDLAAAKHGHKLPPGVANFLDYCKTSLWPAAEKAGREMGLSPFEQQELAHRMIQAAVGQLASASKRAEMREYARRM